MNTTKQLILENPENVEIINYLGIDANIRSFEEELEVNKTFNHRQDSIDTIISKVNHSNTTEFTRWISNGVALITTPENGVIIGYGGNPFLPPVLKFTKEYYKLANKYGAKRYLTDLDGITEDLRKDLSDDWFYCYLVNNQLVELFNQIYFNK